MNNPLKSQALILFAAMIILSGCQSSFDENVEAAQRTVEQNHNCSLVRDEVAYFKEYGEFKYTSGTNLHMTLTMYCIRKSL